MNNVISLLTFVQCARGKLSKKYMRQNLQMSETKTVILIINCTRCQIVINLNVTTDLHQLLIKI